MRVRLLLAAATCASLFLGCRGCEGSTNKVKPILAVTPNQLNFGKVKVGQSAELVGTLEAQSNTSVSITGWTLSDGPIAGAAAAYSVVEKPDGVPPLGKAEYRVRFTPTDVQAYEATLIIASNDPEHPTFELPITGEGAHPLMAVTPECNATLGCEATVVESPPAIDFGPEPFQRQVEIPATKLPKINLVNESDVELVVTKIAFEGPDASAFSFVTGPSGLPPFPLTLKGGEGVNLSIRFKPTSDGQDGKTDYAAQVVVEGDDPDHPQITVALTGKLGPNLPPKVCANIIKVKPGDGSPQLNYDTRADWDPLLVPPPGGYDFTQTRDITPKSLVNFSAISDSADQAACTSDPEDQRKGLTFQWTVTKWPEGASQPALANPTTEAPSFTPIATGEYEVTLEVKDVQGHASSTTLKFAVVRKEDLVVELSWGGDSGAYAGIDLDLHLVRPSSATSGDDFSGVFSYFDEGPNASTSGDISGWSQQYYDANKALGIDFSWGENGLFSDPHLNFDDKGGGQLIENISLNHPENDPACANAACAYKVVVHYFSDSRVVTNPPACTIDQTSCRDGDACTCTGADARCVADTAPKGAFPPVAAGKCYDAPEPVVRIFFKANPVPAAVIPLSSLMPPDELKLGAPCQAIYLADVVWPSKADLTADAGTPPEPTVVVKGADGEGRIVAPLVSRFGIRGSDRKCAPNIAVGSSSQDNWYAEEPR